MRKLLSIGAVSLLAISPAAADPSSAQIDSAAKDIVGAWKLEFTTPDDVERTPTLLVGRQREELVAWYVEEDKHQPFDKVRLQDDSLSLTIRPKERQDVTVTFDAKLRTEGVCAGTGTYTSDDGDTGSWYFTGKRVSPSEFGQVEKWQLDFVTPDEQRHEAVVTVVCKDDRHYGWYSGKDHELPLKQLTADRNGVAMSLTVKTRDGATVDVTFRGTVEGDRVNGDVDYDREGETGGFPFQGQRRP